MWLSRFSARGLGQDSHEKEGPRLLLTACSEDVPLQSVKYLLSSHDDKVKLGISRHPKATRVLLCQCINYFLDVQEAIVTSKRKSEERNELITWVLQLAQIYICALAVAISKKKNPASSRSCAAEKPASRKAGLSKLIHTSPA